MMYSIIPGGVDPWLMVGGLALALLVVLMAAAVAYPALTLYRRALREDESAQLKVQVNTMADEVMRLQKLVDQQQGEISKLQVEITKLRASQRGVLEMAKKLSLQIEGAGHTPIVDVDKLGELLP